MKKVLGIIFSNMHEHNVTELTAKRCMGSIPVGGRYRLIDFVLSNFTNSGVEEVGVVTKSNYQSLMDHLGSGRAWDLSRKRRGLVILPPFGRAETGMYRGRIDALAGIMGFLKGSTSKQVILADCDMLANMDFAALVEAHRASGCPMTLMYKRMDLQEDAGKEQTVLELDEDGKVCEALLMPNLTGTHRVYLNIMVADREFLQDLVEDCISRGKYAFESDIIQWGLGRYDIGAFEFEGYLSRFNSLLGYYHANMALLQPEVREALFPIHRPIYTKIRDEAPVRYGLDNRVAQSLLADGCIVEGEVENSILFRGVRVEKGASVKNCILMQGTRVGAGSNLNYVITDKDVTIRDDRMIMGFDTYPVYIAKGSAV